jgi:ADP-heptose:LPS heptosyltransferase
MSIGEARKLHKQSGGQKVVIVGRDGRPIKSDLFEGVPYICQRPRPSDGPFQRLINGPGHRPYIAAKTPERWTWRKYKPTPAEIVFTPEELAFAEPYRDAIMVEPNTKAIGHTNKAWSAIRWQHLDNEMRKLKLRVVQCGPQGARFLNHATPVYTDTFRKACAVLSVCKAFVGTEGGLMHAAAAVSTPAVILWSEFISPNVTGYDAHRNIRHAGSACGRRTDCPSCQASMLAITVDEVLDNLKEILK